MIQVIVGTNRPDSNSMGLAKISQELLVANGAQAEILDLREVPFKELDGGQYSKDQPEALTAIKRKLNKAQGLLMVVPEYNGSMPGILKYFIDHWTYPDTFECRPVAFIGLGGRFGGLRPVEHLQQVFGYRNGYIFPERVFVSNVWNVLKDEKITDDLVNELLEKQAKNFVKFIGALESVGLDANSVLAKKG